MIENWTFEQKAIMAALAAVIIVPALAGFFYAAVLLFQKAKYRAWKNAVKDTLERKEEDEG